jgi:hypothetical protein
MSRFSFPRNPLSAFIRRQFTYLHDKSSEWICQLAEMFYSNGAEYLARPLFRVTKVMAHGSLILVDKTRGERRGHPFRTLEESNLIWNKIFFFSYKSYKLERFFPFSVTGETAGLFRDLSFTSHMPPPHPLIAN